MSPAGSHPVILSQAGPSRWFWYLLTKNHWCMVCWFWLRLWSQATNYMTLSKLLSHSKPWFPHTKKKKSEDNNVYLTGLWKGLICIIRLVYKSSISYFKILGFKKTIYYINYILLDHILYELYTIHFYILYGPDKPIYLPFCTPVSTLY